MTKKILAIVLSIIVLTTIVATTISLAKEQPQPIEQVELISEAETQPPVIIIETEPIKATLQKSENYYTTCEVNVRYTPDMGLDPYMTIPRGTIVNVVDEADGWSIIVMNGSRYFIKSEYLIDETTWNNIPYSDVVPLDYEVQAYLWLKCKENNIPYCFFLATIDFESDFNPNAFNRRSIDRGLCQVNKCWVNSFKKMGWINCADDLFNVYTNIDCGMYIMMEAINTYGVCEQAYAFYNTGNPKVHSNKNSRQVMRDWEKWKSILGDI